MSTQKSPDSPFVPQNPVQGILAEVEKAKRAGKKAGILSLKPANDWIEDAASRPDPRFFFHGLIAEGENTVIFASTNVGKSILAVMIAEDIAWTDKVVYVDLELSDKQFQLRYFDRTTGEMHKFPSNFIRAEIDPDMIVGTNLEQAIIDSIEDAAKQGVKFFIIDNLTYICHDNEKSAIASEFMIKLRQLKFTYGLTTIVVAHTPKRRGYEPITINDLAGSARLGDFFDAGIALARSARDNNLRYLKQVKVRSCEFKHDSDNVVVYDLVKEDGFLRFVVHGYANEEEHLKNGNPAEDLDEIYDILRLQKQGKSLREIAKVLDISLGKVQRRLQKAKDENITLPPEEDDDVSTVSPVSDNEEPIQPIHDTDQTLPFDNGGE